jgi:hypothetical protein
MQVGLALIAALPSARVDAASRVATGEAVSGSGDAGVDFLALLNAACESPATQTSAESAPAATADAGVLAATTPGLTTVPLPFVRMTPERIPVSDIEQPEAAQDAPTPPAERPPVETPSAETPSALMRAPAPYADVTRDVARVSPPLDDAWLDQATRGDASPNEATRDGAPLDSALLDGVRQASESRRSITPPPALPRHASGIVPDEVMSALRAATMSPSATTTAPAAAGERSDSATSADASTPRRTPTAADSAAEPMATPARSRATSAANPLAVARDLDALAPEFRRPLTRVMARLRDEGYRVAVNETVRSQSRQDVLYAQGRTAPGPVVTWTRRSHHREGRAADLVVDGPNGKRQAFARLQEVAADEGLRTLGRKDPGHVELTGTVVAADAPPLASSREAPALLSPSLAAPPLAAPSIAPSAGMAARVDVAQRVERVAELLQARTATSLSQVALQVSNESGDVTRILVALRGQAVRASIQAADAGRAAELSASTARLQDALTSLGLRTEDISVRQASAVATVVEPSASRSEGRESPFVPLVEPRQASGTIFARSTDREPSADAERRAPRQAPYEDRPGHRGRRSWNQESA